MAYIDRRLRGIAGGVDEPRALGLFADVSGASGALDQEAAALMDALKRRVGGAHGHLSNVQAARMLEHLASPALHTLVLAHLSQHNNTPDLAREAARSTLQELGYDDVRVLVASQDAIGENVRV